MTKLQKIKQSIKIATISVSFCTFNSNLMAAEATPDVMQHYHEIRSKMIGPVISDFKDATVHTNNMPTMPGEKCVYHTYRYGTFEGSKKIKGINLYMVHYIDDAGQTIIPMTKTPEKIEYDSSKKDYGDIEPKYLAAMINDIVKPLAIACPDAQVIKINHYFSDVFFYDSFLPKNNRTTKREVPIGITPFIKKEMAWALYKAGTFSGTLLAEDGGSLYKEINRSGTIASSQYQSIHKGFIIKVGGYNMSVWRRESLNGTYSADLADHEYYKRRKAGSPLAVFARVLRGDGSPTSIMQAAKTFDPTDRSGITWEPGKKVSASILCNNSNIGMRMAIKRDQKLKGWSYLSPGQCKAPFNSGTVALEIQEGSDYRPYLLNTAKANKRYVEGLDQWYCVPSGDSFETDLSQATIPSNRRCPAGARPLHINIRLKATDLDTRYTLSLGG